MLQVTRLARSAIIGLTFMVAACGGDVQGTALTPAFLESPDQIQRVSNRLDPAERQLFGMYVANRAFTSSTGMGFPLLRPDGKDPATVAEAIAVARAFKAKTDQMDALERERDAKDKAFLARLDELRGPMESSGHAPSETDAYNAVVNERDAMLSTYNSRIQAIQGPMLSPPAPAQ